LREVRVPVQLWRAADDDQVPDAWNTALVRQQIRVDGHVIPAGGHFAFFPPCNAAIQKWAPQICASPKGFDRAAFHREFNGAVTEFFRKKL